MPEIPDLNVFRKNLSERLVGKTLEQFNVIVQRKLKVPESNFKDQLEGQRLTGITREGKELHFAFENGHVLGLHLMLYGTMFWYERTNENRFTIAELLFSDEIGLAITDWQKAVILTLDPKATNVPDALSIPDGYLLKAFKNTDHLVKTVLTEGKVVRGIGNAYVDEILYAAKVSPFSKANKIPEKKVDVILKAITTVLADAEKHISEAFPDTITEKERDFLRVHLPKHEYTPAGESILKAEIKSRKTYYTQSQEIFD